MTVTTRQNLQLNYESSVTQVLEIDLPATVAL
jgi:hypothetical protein